MFTPFAFVKSAATISPVGPSPFIMVVKSDNAGSSTSTQFTLRNAAVSSGTTFDVTFSPISDPTDITSVTLDVSSPTINFPVAGTYIVRVDPTTFNRIQFNNTGDKLKLLTITQWGTVVWSTMTISFSGCSNMDVTATDYPDLSIVTTMSSMFNACTSLVGTSDFNNWNTSNVTNMSNMFLGCTLFNQNIGGWNVSNVTTIFSMFQNAAAFNNGGSSSIGGWNVSNVTSFAFMFRGPSAFNQDISGWNISSATNLSSMFRGTTAFNQNISGWNVSNITTFSNMFQDATAFNQNLGSWALKTTATLPSLISIFTSSGMSCANYTDTIVGWANYVNTNGEPKSRSMTTQTGRVFANDRSGGAGFANSGAARTYLTGALPDGGWTISGDTVQASC
jgi:surface protein